MSWLSNAWIVGTGTGILSGILVTLIAQLILSRKEKRDYRKNVAEANREIVLTIRSGIPEEQIPTTEVILALSHSTARRYGVVANDLYTPLEISEELIKEVMDSSFLPSAKKSEYSKLILPIGAELVRPEVINQPVEERALIERRRALVSTLSLMLGLLAGVLTMLAYVYSSEREFLEFRMHGADKSLPLIMGTIGGSFIILMVATVGFYFTKSVHRVKEIRKHSSDSDSDSNTFTIPR